MKEQHNSMGNVMVAIFNLSLLALCLTDLVDSLSSEFTWVGAVRILLASTLLLFSVTWGIQGAMQARLKYLQSH